MLTALLQWSPVIMTVLNFIGVIFLLFLRSKFTPREEFGQFEKLYAEKAAALMVIVEATDKANAGLSERIRILEKELEHIPKVDQIHELSEQITELRGEFKAVDQKFELLDRLGDRMQKQVDRIEGFLTAKP